MEWQADSHPSKVTAKVTKVPIILYYHPAQSLHTLKQPRLAFYGFWLGIGRKLFNNFRVILTFWYQTALDKAHQRGNLPYKLNDPVVLEKRDLFRWETKTKAILFGEKWWAQMKAVYWGQRSTCLRSEHAQPRTCPHRNTCGKRQKAAQRPFALRKRKERSQQRSKLLAKATKLAARTSLWPLTLVQPLCHDASELTLKCLLSQLGPSSHSYGIMY